MTQTLEPATLDHAKLEAFVFRAVDEVGAATLTSKWPARRRSADETTIS